MDSLQWVKGSPLFATEVAGVRGPGKGLGIPVSYTPHPAAEGMCGHSLTLTPTRASPAPFLVWTHWSGQSQCCAWKLGCWGPAGSPGGYVPPPLPERILGTAGTSESEYSYQTSSG